eukprot:SAG31_NODE_37_length_31616_cov_38.688359_10_plen_1872_part_00
MSELHEWPDPGATATDAVEGNVTADITRSGSVDLTAAGTYDLVYTVEDSVPNPASVTRRVTVLGYGCTDSTMFNFDPGAIVDSGTCVAYSFGCTDEDAFNYDSNATTDRCRYGAVCTGTAAYVTVDPEQFPTIEPEYHELHSWCDCAAGYGGTHCQEDVDDCSSSPCTNGQCIDAVDSYWCDCFGVSTRGVHCDQALCSAPDDDCAGDATCVLGHDGSGPECTCSYGFGYVAGVGCQPVDDCSSNPCLNGGTCVDEVGHYACICPTDSTGLSCGIAVASCNTGTCVAKVYGCMDVTMFNYDSTANVNQNCEAIIYGCIDRSMFNWNSAANTDDGTCIPYVYGCTDTSAFNFDPAANCGSPVRCDDFSMCIDRVYGCADASMFNFDSSANTDDGTCVPFIDGCMDQRAANYSPLANSDDGSCQILGCTSTLATNYQGWATFDDGSCTIYGCTNSRAANFLAVATVDDGACEVTGCTDPYAFNYDYHANTNDGSCKSAILGCMNTSASNYDNATNVEDGSCLDTCVNDLRWTDSDGDGCSAYFLSYCGFETSYQRCPTLCGRCDLNIRPGCDGIPGSGLELDECQVCGGDGTLCELSCSDRIESYCTSDQNIYVAAQQSEAASCAAYIRSHGGVILAGAIVLTEEDCERQPPTLPAWKFNGFNSSASCINSLGCGPGSGGDSCVFRQSQLTPTAWQMYGCPAFRHSSFVCNATAVDAIEDESGLPDVSGEYDHGVALALANGLFSHSSVFRDCEATCLHSAENPSAQAWQWMPLVQCWRPVSSDHACLQSNPSISAAVSAVENFCPPGGTAYFSPAAYLTIPTHVKLYEANDTGAPDPNSVVGGGWIRSPSIFTEGVTAQAVHDGSTHGWIIEDSSTSDGVASYYKTISSKEAATARTCGWSLKASLKVVSCRSRSNHVTVKFGDAERYALSFCLTSSDELLVQTTFATFVVPTADRGLDSYYTYVLAVDPRDGLGGATLHADGVHLNADDPLVPDGSSRGIASAVSWGTASTFGRSSVSYNRIEWNLLDGSCLHNLSTYEGCMDARFSNFDPNAKVQASDETCIDTDAPVLSFPNASLNVTQFGAYQLPTAIAFDRVDRDVTSLVQQTGQVDTSTAGQYVLEYTVIDSAGNSANAILTVTVLEFDECASRPCQNHAVCTQSVVEPNAAIEDHVFICACAPGWEGLDCGDDIDECGVVPCQNSALCFDSTDDVLIEACDGRCSMTPAVPINLSSFECICMTGFEGPVCAIDINECESAPCQNGGTCLDSSSGNSTAFGAYDCICVEGWDGENCFADVDDCLSMPCQNGATCSDAGTNSYVCVCVFGWENVNCDVQVNPCLNGDHECAEQATCAHIGPGMFNCSCIAGWEGDGRSCADVDECLSSPCQNGASCADSTSDTSLAVDFYNCNCSTGWMSDNCVQDVDECASSPCENGGTCYDSSSATNQATLLPQVGEFVCLCAQGWSSIDGQHCNHDIDECESSPCQNGGICTESQANATSVGEYECSCIDGFSDSNCATNIDDCQSNPCANGGTCTDAVAQFSCECAPGWEGMLCEQSIDPCARAENPCDINGLCHHTGPGQHTCSCLIGWTNLNSTLSHTCIDVDECESAPCMHQSVCEESGCVSGHVCAPSIALSSFSCRCLPGYAGDRCEIDVDECVSNPCMNGGECVESATGNQSNPDEYSCNCLGGFSGNQCDVDNDECESNPCTNGGSCSDSNDEVHVVAAVLAIHRYGYHCACIDGFSSTNCDDNVDDCSSNPCLNDGICADLIDDFECLCGDSGYEGRICENDIDECASAPCHPRNTIRCEEALASYSCLCVIGYSGPNCEVDDNECVSRPCEHNSSCTQSVNSYSCTCTAGWEGKKLLSRFCAHY